jgi:hypothetical protein
MLNDEKMSSHHDTNELDESSNAAFEAKSNTMNSMLSLITPESERNIDESVDCRRNPNLVHDDSPVAIDHASEDSSHSLRPSTDDALFVNYGLERWEQRRSQWLCRQSSPNDPHSAERFTQKATAKSLDVDQIIELLFQAPKQWREPRIGTSGAPVDVGGPPYFPVPVPLPQMVDILQDLWEAEGIES